MYDTLSLPRRLRLLLDDFRELVFRLRDHRRTLWGRVDPAAELFFDRREKAPRLGFPESVTLYDSVFVCGNVELGENVFVGQFCQLDGSGGLVIGEGTTVATGAKILTHDSVAGTLSGGVLPVEHAPVVIGDRCFIGANAVILKGCRVGSHAVVGAGAVVTGDVPAYAVVAGSPARRIGHVDPETFTCVFTGRKS